MATSSKKFSTFLGKNEHISRSDLQIKEGLEAQPSEFQSPEGDALYGVSGQSGPGQSALAIRAPS
ncbi:hypothetical protein [Pseudomonas sp.]|uniref:hypothetical protein n=1 Tax=Pseudomonas sp. TaxID=306 RepID=UPI0026323E65|nr:hypothetical protein [Pseudomonas sp.]